jgi:S1-C subfamily serine protease
MILLALVMVGGCKEHLELPRDGVAANEVQAEGVNAEPAPAQTPAVTPPSPSARTEDEKNTIDVFRAAAPATVFVTQTQLVRSGYSARALEVPAGSGTGFIWDRQGHIVTNYHVVHGGSSYNVTLFNQKSYKATLVGGEPRRDIAVLKIEAPEEELTAILVPEEDVALDVGQKTIAIGNPFGLDHTLTTGVISALGREVLGFGKVTIRDMIQTDASINPGNSGGPLLDSSGHLIGMNTMIYSESGSSAGIGFAVPVSTIRRIVPQIIKTGKAEQVGLGIAILPDDVARRAGVRGVIVQSVQEGSPAEKAGMRGLSTNQGRISLGDVIIAIDGAEINNYNDLYNTMEQHVAGDEVKVSVIRDGNEVLLEVELYVLPD